MPGRLLIVIAVLAALAVFKSSTLAQTAPMLDYEFFKQRVEPIFLTKRPSHARCYVCHVESNNAFHLEKLSANASAWTAEQSRRNFEMVSKLINPGDPDSSRLLLHPLGPEDGGDVFHSGGRQFASKRGADWRTIADWVKGATLASPKKK